MKQIYRIKFFVLCVTLFALSLLPIYSYAQEFERAKAYPADIASWSDEVKAQQRNAAKLQFDKIFEAIDKGLDSYAVPKGDYRIHNSVIERVVFRDVKNFTLDFQGSTLWVEGRSTALEIYYCTNFTIKNLTIDFDPVPYVQGTITEVDVKNSTVTLALDEGFTYPDETWRSQDGLNMKFILFDSDNLMMGARMNWVAANGWEVIDDKTIKVKTRYDYTFTDKGGYRVVPGIKVAIPWRLGGDGIVMDYSNYCNFEGVNIYSSPGMGVRFHYGEGGHTFKNCNFIPRPDTGRLLSTNADILHGYMFGEGGSGTVENCVFEHPGDDCINANAFMHFVYHVIDDTHLFVATNYNQRLVVNEKLNFIDLENGKNLGSARIKKISTVDDSLLTKNVAQIPNAITEQLGITMKTGFTGTAMYYVELDAPLKVKTFDLFSPQLDGAKFTVKNCRFYDSLGRGVVCKISNTVIENSYFGHMGEQAIRILSSRYWLEGASPIENITIKNNTFENNSKNYFSHERDINVELDFSNTDYSHMKNIVINDNKFINPSTGVLIVKNIENMQFKGNTVTWNENRNTPEFYPKVSQISVGVSNNVDVSQNEYVNLPEDIPEIVSISADAKNVIKD